MAEKFNPLLPMVQQRLRALDEISVAISDLEREVSRYERFDRRSSVECVAVDREQAAQLEQQIALTQLALSEQQVRSKLLLSIARAGWNPAHWFSGARSQARTDLTAVTRRIEKLEQELQGDTNRRDAALARIRNANATVEWYDAFNLKEATSSLDELRLHEGTLTDEIDRLRARAAALDDELEAPRSEYEGIRQRVGELKRDLSQAQRYERDLRSASNSYEKKQIHDNCQSRFGDGSPSRLSARFSRDIDRLERDASKLERRLLGIARRASLEVHAIVIDGSNLVYRDGKLIGLFALRALCAELVNKYSVTVVFDSSTRARLGLLNDGALRAQLPGLSVHVTAPATSADETVLDLAEEPTTFVISNDRFADYPEKPAVRDRRVIRHEILDARVIVRDLRLDLRYSTRSRWSGTQV